MMNTKINERFNQDELKGQPVVLAPEEGEKLTAEGVSCTFKITSDLTDDRMGIYEIVLQPQTTGANLHYHRFMAETFIVTKGALTIEMEEGEIVAKEGSVVHVPRFTPHGFCNNSTGEVKLMLVFNPGQKREGFFYGLFEHLNKETIDDQSLILLNERFDNILMK